MVGLFSSRLEPYGGTLGQLVFPCVLAVAFWRKGQPLGIATACAWVAWRDRCRLAAQSGRFAAA
jgi:hypothetical protein